MSDIRLAQAIFCKCGALFAAAVEPHCYTDSDWQKDLRKYVKEGCTVGMIDASAVRFQSCTCNTNQQAPTNQISMFDALTTPNGDKT